ncbi:MAG: hypothetical protein B6I20_14120, partial [Bacteroidetes bacterium 4572_117]
LNNNVLGPEYPVISKTHDLFLKSIIIKLDRTLNIKHLKKNIYYYATQLIKIDKFKNIQIIFDVDPQ